MSIHGQITVRMMTCFFYDLGKKMGRKLAEQTLYFSERPANKSQVEISDF
jgi:hypothetical protein